MLLGNRWGITVSDSRGPACTIVSTINRCSAANETSPLAQKRSPPRPVATPRAKSLDAIEEWLRNVPRKQKNYYDFFDAAALFHAGFVDAPVRMGVLPASSVTT